MKKRWIILILCLLLLPIGRATAAGQSVWDMEGDLTDGQIWVLSEKMSTTSHYYGVDIVIVTADSFDGKSARSYANDFYDHNGYGDNGILLLVSMTQREWYISTAGSCIKTFGSRALDKLEDAIVPKLKIGDVNGACLAFLAQAEDILVKGAAAASTAPWKALLICLGVGALVALIVVLILIAQLKSVRSKQAAADYVRPGSLEMIQVLDLYLYQTTTRREKPKNTSSSSGGRSHGGRGGKF